METKQTDLWRQAQAKLSRHQGDWSALWDQMTCRPDKNFNTQTTNQDK